MDEGLSYYKVKPDGTRTDIRIPNSTLDRIIQLKQLTHDSSAKNDTTDEMEDMIQDFMDTIEQSLGIKEESSSKQVPSCPVTGQVGTCPMTGLPNFCPFTNIQKFSGGDQLVTRCPVTGNVPKYPTLGLFVDPKEPATSCPYVAGRNASLNQKDEQDFNITPDFLNAIMQGTTKQEVKDKLTTAISKAFDSNKPAEEKTKDFLETLVDIFKTERPKAEDYKSSDSKSSESNEPFTNLIKNIPEIFKNCANKNVLSTDGQQSLVYNLFKSAYPKEFASEMKEEYIKKFTELLDENDLECTDEILDAFKKLKHFHYYKNDGHILGKFPIKSVKDYAYYDIAEKVLFKNSTLRTSYLTDEGFRKNLFEGDIILKTMYQQFIDSNPSYELLIKSSVRFQFLNLECISSFDGEKVNDEKILNFNYGLILDKFERLIKNRYGCYINTLSFFTEDQCAVLDQKFSISDHFSNVNHIVDSLPLMSTQEFIDFFANKYESWLDLHNSHIWATDNSYVRMLNKIISYDIFPYKGVKFMEIETVTSSIPTAPISAPVSSVTIRTEEEEAESEEAEKKEERKEEKKEAAEVAGVPVNPFQKMFSCFTNPDSESNGEGDNPMSMFSDMMSGMMKAMDPKGEMMNCMSKATASDNSGVEINGKPVNPIDIRNFMFNKVKKNKSENLSDSTNSTNNSTSDSNDGETSSSTDVIIEDVKNSEID